MLKFADCNIAVGQPNAISGWRIYDSAQIACQAQRCGIQKGLAFCNAALDLHPLDGNAEMCLICRREPFYLPVWMVMPNHTGEFWNVDELERRMRCTCGTPSAEIQCAWLFFARLVQRRTVGYAGAYRHAGTDGCRSVRLGDSARRVL